MRHGWAAVLGAAALALSGCGSAGKKPVPTSTPAASSPVATAAATADPAVYKRKLSAFAKRLTKYAERHPPKPTENGKLQRSLKPVLATAPKSDGSELAGRADAMVAELRNLEHLGEASDIGSKGYLLALKFYDRYLDSNQKTFDATLAAVYGKHQSFVKGQKEVHGVWRRAMRRKHGDFVSFRRRWNKRFPHPRTEMARSVVAYTREEYTRSLREIDGFAQHLKEFDWRSAQIGGYKTRINHESAMPVVGSVPAVYRVALTKGYVKAIGALARGRTPAVGDPYRHVIAQIFVGPLKLKRSSPVIDEQMWLLYRIRQLEDTPADTYAAARDAIALGDAYDARNPYEFVFAAFTAADGEDVTKPWYPKVLDWARAQLDRPFPKLLEPTVKRLRAQFDRIKITGSDLDRLHRKVRVNRRMRKIMDVAARRVDSPAKDRRALVAALRATRA